MARLGVQVASALSYAHARGIIHRDIKPSNVLLDAAGTAWVTDFGLARDSNVGLTRSADIVTLRYMAPERFAGRWDERSDIYALGLTLYELLALEPAFGEPDRATLIDAIRNRSLRPLRRSIRGCRATWRRSSSRPSTRNPTAATPRPMSWPPICSGSWTMSRSEPGRARTRKDSIAGVVVIRPLPRRVAWPWLG